MPQFFFIYHKTGLKGLGEAVKNSVLVVNAADQRAAEQKLLRQLNSDFGVELDSLDDFAVEAVSASEL